MTAGVGAACWLILAVALFLIESVTVQMLCIWFAAGALLAMIAAALGAPIWAQLLVFLAGSVAVLIPGRRFVKNKLLKTRVPTNADQVIGKIAVVQTDIDNIRQTGRVLAGGLDWAARTESDDVFVAAGSEVRVLRIDGVKLIVEPVVPATIIQEG